MASADRPLSIALIAPTPPPFGGIANWTNLIVNAFSDCSSAKLNLINTAPKKRSTDGRSLVDRIIDGFATTVGAQCGLKSLLRADTPLDCVHITTSGSLALFRDKLLLSLARQKGISSIYHMHFGRIPSLIGSSSWEEKALRRNIDLCSKIVCLDESSCAALRASGIPDAKIAKIPNPIDVSLYENETIGIRSDVPKCITYLGWLVPAKGIQELLDAWDLLEGEHEGWTLRRIGPCLKEYKEKQIPIIGA